jgi:hypothetical protein
MKEVTQVLIHPIHYDIDRQRRREQREELRRRRLIAQGRPPRRLRRAVGRSMIQIGRRLSADPMPEPARSR